MIATTLDISEARKKLTKLDEYLHKQNIIWVTRRNKRAFAVVENETMEALLETLEILQDPQALKLLQRSIKDIRSGRVIDQKNLKKEMKTW